MTNSIHQLDTELRKWQQVKPLLGSEFDEQTILDAIEGETDLLECLYDIDDSILADEIQLAGLSAMIAKLQERKERIGKRSDSKRTVIRKAMEKAGLRKFNHATGMVYLQRTARKVMIVDETEIPDAFWMQNPRVDKAAVKKAIESGTPVAGATLSNADETLVIRRS